MMNILHTADWHLGQLLFEHPRLEESHAFLDYLQKVLAERKIDLLIVAGDVFDGANPPLPAQELYFDFLAAATAANPGLHILILAGNHDSPGLLDVPRRLLASLRIHVVGRAAENSASDVFVIGDRLIVAAIPHLRDRDLPPGEREERVRQGIYRRYRDAANQVTELRAKLGELPAVAVGHLALGGANIIHTGGERPLYLGTLDVLDPALIPAEFDYVALGHLHAPQRAGQSGKIHYSGSPLPMSFAERQAKSLRLLEFTGREMTAAELPLPVFRRLTRLEGTLETVEAELDRLRAEGRDDYLEITVSDLAAFPDARRQLEDRLEGAALELLSMPAPLAGDSAALSPELPDESLADLDAGTVFERRLALLTEGNSPDELEDLRESYREALRLLADEDGVLP